MEGHKKTKRKKDGGEKPKGVQKTLRTRDDFIAIMRD